MYLHFDSSNRQSIFIYHNAIFRNNQLNTARLFGKYPSILLLYCGAITHLISSEFISSELKKKSKASGHDRKSLKEELDRIPRLSMELP